MTQSTIFDNSVKVHPIPYNDKVRLSIKINESKEYVTRKGIVIIVTKKKERLSGVGESIVYFQISDRGRVLQPCTGKEVKSYIRVN